MLFLAAQKMSNILQNTKKKRLVAIYIIQKLFDVFFENNTILDKLIDQTDFIVLAGFLWKIPVSIVKTFPNRIINIHPALLPNYGGKGMYGMHVHRAVKNNFDKETGITIHYVNENYEEELGLIKKALLDAKCPFYAIGEIGLDFYWDTTYKEEQIKALRLQIEWAKTYHLPIVVSNCSNNYGPYQFPEKLIPYSILCLLQKYRI